MDLGLCEVGICFLLPVISKDLILLAGLGGGCFPSVEGCWGVLGEDGEREERGEREEGLIGVESPLLELLL